MSTRARIEDRPLTRDYHAQWRFYLELEWDED
jgi:hypothetical protein